MAEFKIHSQLLLDCHCLGRFPSAHVLLHKNAIVPWFILVPETEIADLLDLPQKLRQAVMKDAAAISDFIKSVLGCGKVNFASIGNVVSQLHLHVVGRRPDDPYWPAPVWGNLRESRSYSAAELGDLVEALRCRAPRFIAQR